MDKIEEAKYYAKLGNSKQPRVEVTKQTNKCISCGKFYRYPVYPYKPRDLVCFTCENRMAIGLL